MTATIPTPTQTATRTVTPTIQTPTQTPTGSIVSTAPSQPLTTGQTDCYDSTGTQITCAGSGQDGDLQKGVTRKYTDNGDGTITDEKTGLMWEKLSDDGSIHDHDNNYTWTDALTVKIAALNAGAGFGGHSDWRLPNANEIASIVIYGVRNPATHLSFDNNCQPGCDVTTCSCTPLLNLWSSTTAMSQLTNAWQVYFVDGDVISTEKNPSFPARAVREAGLPSLRARPLVTGQTTCHDSNGDPRACANSGQDGEWQTGEPRQYIDNGDGTITDNKTGLMWEKLSDDGSINDQDVTYTWADAFAVKIATLNAGAGFAGRTDWRLPNANELASLISYYVSASPSIDAAFNSNCQPGCDVTTCSCTPSGNFWSSTTYLAQSTHAWHASFASGAVVGKSKVEVDQVRAVRTAP